MEVDKFELITLKINKHEKDILIRGVSQRLSGWAKNKVDGYKSEMSHSEGPQHYLTGYEKYMRFETEFQDEFDVWEALVGGKRNGLHGSIHSDRDAYDMMEFKRMWIKKFQKVQDEYDNRKKGL